MDSLRDHYQDLDQPQKRGQATETVLQAELVVRDIPVLKPAYDNEPYDFVIEVADEFYRIQAKTATETPSGTVRFETVSTRTRSNGYERDGYEGEIDFFAVFCPSRRPSYLVSIDEAATGKMELRFRAPKNNQQKGINWHEEYLLDARVSSLS